MITRSTIDGWLKSKNARAWMMAGFITAVALTPSALLWYMLEESLDQTQRVIEIAKFWEGETKKWRDIAARAPLLAAMCVLEASKCDAEKCVNACTGAPAMEQRR